MNSSVRAYSNHKAVEKGSNFFHDERGGERSIGVTVRQSIKEDCDIFLK
jgi:hypothetical protein